MNHKLTSILAALALISSSGVALAQVSAAPASKSSQSVGPTVSSNTAGIRAPTESRSLNSRTTDTHMGAGRNVALMVVGGAALIIGAAIGGTAGVLIAVAGAAVGLYGLFNFIQ